MTNFNAAWDAVAVHKALKIGDKKTITNVLCRRSLDQRLEIASAFKTSFKKNLIDEIKSKISGNVKNVYVLLLMTVPELYCQQLRKTTNDGVIESFAVAVLNLSTDFFDGETSDDNVLIEIMCTMTNSEIRKICATYQQMFGKRLEQGIREGKIGNFKKLLSILSGMSRDESMAADLTAAKVDAEVLHKHFSKLLPSETPVIEMLCARSYSQIKLISDEYRKLAGHSLEKSVKKNSMYNIKDALIAIIRNSNHSSVYYARRINKGIHNYVNDNRSLGRLIIVRSEIDLMDIKQEFSRLFRKNIKSSLKDEISGSYRHALLTLLGEN